MAAMLRTTFSNAFFNENIGISIKITLKFVPGGQINSTRAIVRKMVWRRAIILTNDG